MSYKEYKSVLIPRYLANFACTGPACEDTCCKGWTVFIDHETYKKYRRVKHPDLKPLLDKYINRYRSKPTEFNYAKIRLIGNEPCPLQKNSLCSIQATLGEQYLSKTCSVYPRCNNLVDDVLEGSGTVSCPEIARLLLLNPKLIEFDQIDDWQHADYLLIRRFNTSKAKSLQDSIVTLFWPLRIFTIKVLQARSYRLGERLLFLCLFYGRAQALIDSGKSERIEPLIEEYNRMLEDVEAVKTILMAVPRATDIQLKMAKLIMDLRYLHQAGITNQRYLECYHQFLVGLNCEKDNTWDGLLANYENAYKDFVEPWLQEHEYIFENYLVNFVFKDLVPFHHNRSLIESYFILIVNYTYIKALLIGMAAYNKTINEELIVKLIQSFSRTVEHSELFLNNIYDLFKKEGFFQTAYIAALIQN